MTDAGPDNNKDCVLSGESSTIRFVRGGQNESDFSRCRQAKQQEQAIPGFIGYTIKTDGPDPQPDWSEEEWVIWGCRFLAVLFFMSSLRFFALAGAQWGFVILLFGLLIIVAMGAVEPRRIRIKKQRAEDKKNSKEGTAL